MNLATRYLGLDLRTPLVVSASPLTEENDNVKKMADAGASAIVFHSLFEEQLRHEHFQLLAAAIRDGSLAEPGAFSKDVEDQHLMHGSNRYLRQIEAAKHSVKIPIIASLNGTTFGGWTTFARALENAGADALELNLYSIPTNPATTSDEIELSYLTIVASLKAQVKIPIAVKLAPFFTNLSRFAHQLDQHGADGLVLFNRFYQPDIDVDSLTVSPTVQLSTPEATRLPMRWIAMLHGRVQASLAATSGIHRGIDALKMLLAGADVTMVCSVLLQRGIEHITTIERELTESMLAHEFRTVAEIRGKLSQKTSPDPGAFERAQYIRAVGGKETRKR
ncbi:MAG TPA: dihydroorotate dehydrogenase-like protein [Chthoniobacteraceae bacterium]|nr:dihydroorotate dehydrogenase-like protein [Chthoniobacteraceae bacterium]